MSDYEFDGFDDEPPRAKPEASSSGPELPGGVSLQTAAAILLVAVLLATLYLFFGPLPGDSEPLADSDTATSTPRAVATARVTAEGADAPGGATAGASASGRTPEAATTSAPSANATSPSAGATTITNPSSATATLPASTSLRSGGFARVTGTGSFGLRMRFGPSLDYLTIRFAEEGETVEITGGPERGSDITWWRARDGRGNVGWVAAEYLVPAAAPSSWAPPVASPTFPAGAESLEESTGADTGSGIGASGAPIAAVTVIATTSPSP